MGKGWKKDGMLANAQKKGAQFTKIAKEIAIAAKLGGPDPEANSRLRMAIESAKKISCPKDTIERALKKGAGQLDGEAEVEEVTYEGYGPHGVGIIVECHTDNRNRSAADLRALFKKAGGNLGESGSVTWMFDRVSLIEARPPGAVGDPETVAIEVGANEVENGDEDGSYAFYGVPEDLDVIRKSLIAKDWSINVAELSYRANNVTEISSDQKQEIYTFMNILDDHEDSHRIYASLANA